MRLRNKLLEATRGTVERDKSRGNLMETLRVLDGTTWLAVGTGMILCLKTTPFIPILYSLVSAFLKLGFTFSSHAFRLFSPLPPLLKYGLPRYSEAPLSTAVPWINPFFIC